MDSWHRWCFFETLVGFCGLGIRLYPVFILYGCSFRGARAREVGSQRDGWDMPGADMSWGSGGSGLVGIEYEGIMRLWFIMKKDSDS